MMYSTHVKRTYGNATQYPPGWHVKCLVACFVCLAELSQAADLSSGLIQSTKELARAAAAGKVPRDESENRQPKPNTSRTQKVRPDSSQERYEKMFIQLPNQRTWIGSWFPRDPVDEIDQKAFLFLQSLFNNDVQAFLEKTDRLRDGVLHNCRCLGRDILEINFTSNTNLTAASLIQTYAPEYRSTKDAFKKRDIVEQLKPLFEKWIQEGRQHSRIAWVQRSDAGSIGHGVSSTAYDVPRKGYALGEINRLRAPADTIGKPRLIAGNCQELKYLPFVEMEESRARELADWTDSNVHGNEWNAKGAKPSWDFHVYFEGEITNQNTSRTFTVKVTKMDVYLTKWEWSHVRNSTLVKVKRLLSKEMIKSIEYP